MKRPDQSPNPHTFLMMKLVVAGSATMACSCSSQMLDTDRLKIQVETNRHDVAKLLSPENYRTEH